VAAILPSSIPIGDGNLTLTFGSDDSNTVPIRVVAIALGIFTRNQSGSGPGVLFNFNSQDDQPVNSLVIPAQPGQVLTLWGTGLGAVDGDEAAGPLPGNLDIPVDVFVGMTQVTPSYQGRSGCCAGIDQIVFTVPDGVEGCYVSVHVRANGVISNSVTIAVTADGSICSDPTGFAQSDLGPVANGQALNVADNDAIRVHAKLSLPGGDVDANVDLANGKFRHYVTADDVLASTHGSVGGLTGLPSAGSCVVAPFSFQDFTSSIFGGGGDPVNVYGLDAGEALTLAGPNGAIQLPRQNNGSAGSPDYRYRTQGSIVGGGIPNLTPVVLPDFLDPGDYTLDNGSGGAEVGQFSTMLTIPDNTFVWTNEDSFDAISLSNDLTVTWDGADPNALVLVFGSAADPNTGAGARFQCVAPADSGTLTIPQWVLSALPASGTDSSVGVPVGFLSVGVTLPQPSVFQADGIDIGFFNWGGLETKNVVFQ
jgi:uncharacterized protein (TIGR03437 family)